MSFCTCNEMEGAVWPSVGLSCQPSDVDPFLPHDTSFKTSHERWRIPSLPFLLPAHPGIKALLVSSQPATGRWGGGLRCMMATMRRGRQSPLPRRPPSPSSAASIPILLCSHCHHTPAHVCDSLLRAFWTGGHRTIWPALTATGWHWRRRMDGIELLPLRGCGVL